MLKVPLFYLLHKIFYIFILNHVVEYFSDKLDVVFHALSDSTRREMLMLLAKKKNCTISELSEPFSISFTAASKHVKVLEKAGLLKRRIEGRNHYCTFAPEALDAVESWISFYKTYWLKRLDALESLLRQKEGKQNG